MKDTLAQQCESCPAKHHAFDEFDPGDLTFHLPIAVDECQSGQDSRFVSLKTIGKTLEFLDTTGFHLAQPGIELRSLTGVDKAKKLLDELIDRLCCGAGLTHGQEFFLLLLLQFLKWANEEPDRL